MIRNYLKSASRNMTKHKALSTICITGQRCYSNGGLPGDKSGKGKSGSYSEDAITSRTSLRLQAFVHHINSELKNGSSQLFMPENSLIECVIMNQV